MKDRFIVGSNAFFKDIDGFKAHDKDVLVLIDNPIDFKIQRQIRLNGNCIFEWKRMTPKEYIDYHKTCECGMFIGKFLVPEFVKEIGFTINDLKELECLLDKLDDKHFYEKIIYEYYIENNDFYLTDEQLKNVYKIYKK